MRVSPEPASNNSPRCSNGECLVEGGMIGELSEKLSPEVAESGECIVGERVYVCMQVNNLLLYLSLYNLPTISLVGAESLDMLVHSLMNIDKLSLI
jgi:hypothetical protein